ncbi:carnitine O-acetyltransferase CAT2 [Ascoidea rubescens DSM 1968]|uniref:Carnitine O-acetyltransferase, mitochondrial n=1 Tax=Ascoidea rubescens DSM 1968 TaxID=1344418 RepID=A0A1D2VKV1_9ASCO|nr:acyltransferase ChoActase/COT/CPT [Ascoidea rubescens DSM 1968]ODV62208.1 acyltransferase ChoActase/COT/CPT [Ascoidea rubescens DSM 1968]
MAFSTSLANKKGDMLSYFDKMPQLPVPDLNDSAALYLQSIKPLVSSEEHYKSIESKLKDFIKPNGQGQILQKRLEDKSADPKTQNWLSEWWDNDAYLAYRDPVIPYVSYFFSHAENVLPAFLEKNQLKKASLLISSIIDFKEQVDNETLPPELIRGQFAFCMASFKFMFNNCRIPEKPSDTTAVYDPLDLKNQFLIVIKNNRFYKLYHHDKNNKKLSNLQILNQLNQIYFDATSKSNGIKQKSIGSLTTLDRDSWTDAYKELKNYTPVNNNSLEEIHKSSFVLCLDDYSPLSLEERSRYAWHGDGRNRFFDKPLQFFVASNGQSGFLGEHSKMDGTPTLQLNNYIGDQFKKISQNAIDPFNPSTQDSSLDSLIQQPTELKFDISPSIASQIDSAEKSFDALLGNHDLKVWRYPGYGKSLIKKFKSSPDAFVQMLIQLAYYKYTGEVKPTYESASTRKYKWGRTETNRTVSEASKKFVETWCNKQSFVSNKDKAAAFYDAINSQNSYIKLASDGLGCDRHIYGLKKSILPGEEPHQFLKDQMTSYSSSWFLSTSQLSSEYFNGYGWSQVHDLGFGLAYMINNEWLNINIVCKKDNPTGLNVQHMYYYLTLAADELKQVLTEVNAEPVKPKL